MHFPLALAALVIEALAGYPPALFARVGHPVSWIGALIFAMDVRFNRERDSFAMRRAKGIVALFVLLGVSFAVGAIVSRLIDALSLPGFILLALLASSLIAQRSLHDHVAEVAAALRVSLDDGRQAVAKIVGRDVNALGEAGVARAAVESLAENFSDGVVAPALWLATLGLPGALAFKTVSTADSMIGHKSPRYLAFGWASARCDDLMNLVPARATAGLLAAAAFTLPGASPAAALAIAWRDGSGHASPNAGWPEAAMAGALGFSLGGPRAYHGALLNAATLGDGRRDLGPADIDRALALYRRAIAALWLLLAAGVTISSNIHRF